MLSFREAAGSSSIEPAFIKHDQVVVQRDVFGHAVARAQRVAAPLLTDVERLADPLANGRFIRSAEKVNIDAPQQRSGFC